MESQLLRYSLVHFICGGYHLLQQRGVSTSSLLTRALHLRRGYHLASAAWSLNFFATELVAKILSRADLGGRDKLNLHSLKQVVCRATGQLSISEEVETPLGKASGISHPADGASFAMKIVSGKNRENMTTSVYIMANV